MHPEELATMTWNERRAVAERGIGIGSHTLTHPHLPECRTKSWRASYASRGRSSRTSSAVPAVISPTPYCETDERFGVEAPGGRAPAE